MLTARHIATELQADMHRQVHVHSGMPCKFNHYIHVCLARNYPEALSQWYGMEWKSYSPGEAFSHETAAVVTVLKFIL